MPKKLSSVAEIKGLEQIGKQLKTRAKRVKTSAKQSAKEVRSASNLLLGSVKKGYQRIKQSIAQEPA